MGGTVSHPGEVDNSVDVTLFVPCYNEEQNVVPTLRTIVEACKQVGCSYEAIVIDDASKDRSVERVRTFQDDHPKLPIRLICNPVNMGLAHNFLEGAFLGTGKHYRIVCGDNVEPLATQVAILARMNQAELVLPYPIVVENKTPFRRLLSRIYTHLVNFVSGRRLRYWNGCGLLLREDIMRYQPNTRGFGFQALLVARLLRLGRTYVDVGCTYTERQFGKSRALTIKNFISVAHCLLSILLERVTGRQYPPSPNISTTHTSLNPHTEGYCRKTVPLSYSNTGKRA
jgi:glycosyltransferase involved in cell wall biosynthesis